MEARQADATGYFSLPWAGTFIEGATVPLTRMEALHFPSLSEGLSLRVRFAEHALTSQRRFPFLFGGAFIEAMMTAPRRFALNISLPFWKGFH